MHGWWGGWEIEGLLARPAGDGPYPTLMFPHGGPVTNWRPRFVARNLLQIRNLANTAGLPDPEQVFLRYYRGPKAHMHTGTGLGLYLVRTLARVQDGDVGYRVVGDATVEFSLRLPATP